METIANVSEKAERYEELIQGKLSAKNAQEKIIQKFTRTDAGLVLAIIGVEHPASVTVQRYLAEQKCSCLSPKAVLLRALMIRWHHDPVHNQ